MKKILGFILLIYILLLMPGPAVVAAPVNSELQPAFSLQDAMKNVDLSALEDYKQHIDGEISNSLTGKPLKDWIGDFIKGNWSLNLKILGNNLIKLFVKEVVANSGLLGKILILSVLAALLVNLQTTFSSEVARMSYMACFMALGGLAVGSFKVVLEIGHNTIDNMVAFMMSMLPQMLVLTAGMGKINTSTMLFPILMTTSTALANAMKNIVFPLIIMSAILSIVNHLSDTLKVERMSKFFKQMSQLSLAFFLTIFVGILTLRALYASVLDKIALRTTKFVTDNAIPVVGKIFSDTIEVAAGYVVMIKQALGIFGVLVIVGIIIIPLLKIAVIALIYKFSAAVVEPMGDARTAAILEAMSTHLFLMLAAVAAVGLMFFIMIGIVAGISNGFSMLQ